MTEPCCTNCASGKRCSADLPEGSWLERVGGSVSQLLNAAILNGHPNESVSARAWRERRTRWVHFINALFFSDAHCQDSHAQDVKWAQHLLDATARSDNQRVS